jgi:hypothetical protein
VANTQAVENELLACWKQKKPLNASLVYGA